MDYKEQLYIAAETNEADCFNYEDLFDNKQMSDTVDCDGDIVTTIYEGTVANCFKLKIIFSECPYDGYQWTSMYLDDKEVYTGQGIAMPVFLNSILIECIADVETDDISIDDTL